MVRAVHAADTRSDPCAWGDGVLRMDDSPVREALVDALRRTRAAGSARCAVTARSGSIHGTIDFAHEASAWSHGNDAAADQNAIYVGRRAFWFRPGAGWDEMQVPDEGSPAGLGFATLVLQALEDPAWRVQSEVEAQADARSFRLTRTAGDSPHPRERSIVVRLDTEGRIRRLEERTGPLVDDAGKVVLEAAQTDYEFSDFGAPVVIEPPPQDQIATITTEDDLLAELDE
jgi:hypothetical protein